MVGYRGGRGGKVGKVGLSAAKAPDLMLAPSLRSG